LIRTIIFDFGNVVAFFDHGRALRQLARFTDMDPVELGLVLYGSPIEDAYERGAIPTPEYVREALLNGRLTCTPDEFLTCYCDIFWPNPDVIDLVPRLEPRYRLVLGSNTNDAHFGRFSRDYAAVFARFDHLGTSHRAGARKPQPEFFAHVQRYTQAEPAECLFVDDLPVNVEAAQRFGWEGIVYRPDGTLPQKLRAAGVEIG
jgi:putative hydrolase of the HAD superfamily